MSEAPILTDGIIELSAFTLDDVTPHVDAEDGESVTWLTDGRSSTIATTRNWAAQHLRWWETGGPRRMFAIRVAGKGTLAGMIEANLDSDSCGLPAGEVNISFMVQSWARGRGFATRAVELMCNWLEGFADVEVAVLRIDPDNTASLGVASRARFEDAGRITTPDGDHYRYFRRVLRWTSTHRRSPGADHMSSKPHQPARRGQPPTALLLDLDGTLLDGSLLPSVIANVCEVVAATTDGLDADQLLEANRHAFQTSWPQLEQEWALGRLDSASVALTLWRRSLETCGYHDEQLAQLALQEHQRLELDSYRLFDDVQDVLASIGGSCRLALVTNGTSETQRAKLRVVGLERHLDAVVISGEVGVAKPDPGLFRSALDRLGVPASAAWHVGDRLDTDVAGARAAGLVSVWLNRTGRALRRDEAEPDFEIRSLQELLHVFSP